MNSTEEARIQKRSACLWTCALLAFSPLSIQRAAGMFVRDEIQNVPIARIFTNLQGRLVRDTNDFEATYYLARLHAMAYSTNQAVIEVRTRNDLPRFYGPGYDSGVPKSVQTFTTSAARVIAFDHLTNAIALYERAIYLLKKSTNASERTWMVLPTQLGLGWCLDQAGRTSEAITTYRKTLKVAWQKEVTGEFDFKQWANEVWNDVRAGRNPVRDHTRAGFIGPGVCFSEEVIGYLLRLLDPVKDASEIARLKEDLKTLNNMGRAVTPILIPLIAGARLEELVDEKAAVPFDLDGSGFKREWGWLTPNAGWLVFDPERTGRVTPGLQLFGNATFWIFWPDGYQALSALDDDGDGSLTGSELQGLAVWVDRNCDGVSQPGEVVTVESLGIQSLSCESKQDDRGMRWSPQGVTFTNGTSRPTYDWIAPSRAITAKE